MDVLSFFRTKKTSNVSVASKREDVVESIAFSSKKLTDLTGTIHSLNRDFSNLYDLLSKAKVYDTKQDLMYSEAERLADRFTITLNSAKADILEIQNTIQPINFYVTKLNHQQKLNSNEKRIVSKFKINLVLNDISSLNRKIEAILNYLELFSSNNGDALKNDYDSALQKCADLQDLLAKVRTHYILLQEYYVNESAPLVK